MKSGVDKLKYEARQLPESEAHDACGRNIPDHNQITKMPSNKTCAFKVDLMEDLSVIYMIVSGQDNNMFNDGIVLCSLDMYRKNPNKVIVQFKCELHKDRQ